DVERLRIFPGNTPPELEVKRPGKRTRWRSNDPIRFAGQARDREQGRLPARALDWELLLRHCARDAGCHTHPIQELEGTRRGSFLAPEHELPAHLRLRVTATDGDGLAVSRSIRLQPRTARVMLTSEPSGLWLGLNNDYGPTPVTRRVIVGSQFTLIAPTPQGLDGVSYEWSSWSDGGEATHNTVAEGDLAIGATFAPAD
ncbi:MAG: sugar dehydrogenase, partial [Solirubrobacterales bacterium]